MLEVEMKFPCSVWEPILAKVTEWGARSEPPRVECDSYFNAPDRDFAKTDEALRLRQIGDGNRFTYKGPKLDTITKTRTEIELPLGDGSATAEDAKKFLTSLGYRFVAAVRKTRRVYSFTKDGFHLEICFDDVDRVGKFVEVEILTEPSELDRAKAALLQTVSELGLKEQQRKSYLRMLLEGQ